MGARHKVAETLITYARQSKHQMKSGVEPICLLDFWSQVCGSTIIVLTWHHNFQQQEINNQLAQAESNGTQAAKHCEDFEMGNTLMDFLFASQDASTASLTWIFALLDQYPEMLQKVIQFLHC